MTHRISSVLLIISLFIISSVCISHAATPQETLTQYISDLQKNPNDNALEMDTLYEARLKNRKEAEFAFDKLIMKNGIKNNAEWEKKEKENPGFQQQVQAMVDTYWKRNDKGRSDAFHRSFKDFMVDVAKFHKRQGEKEKGGKQ